MKNKNDDRKLPTTIFMNPSSNLRWKVSITYKQYGFKTYFIEELEELQEIVERGPDWNDLVDIRITYNR